MRKSISILITILYCLNATSQRQVIPFTGNWKFFLGDDSLASRESYHDQTWRVLNLPHDWSIEGAFSEKHPTTFNQGALPAGVGWYRKAFTVPAGWKGRSVFINFDGVYRNSEVWVNGRFIGKRPNGYSSFRYEITDQIRTGNNVIAVRVDNSQQPSSRWYTGSGIYRKVWLEVTDPVRIGHWEHFITTPYVSSEKATVAINYLIESKGSGPQRIKTVSEILDATGKRVSGTANQDLDSLPAKGASTIEVLLPRLWSTDKPYLYKAITRIFANGKEVDRVETPFGIRSFHFDAGTGFYLNQKPLKILGVCNHHDLGALGAAVNVHALERQLRLLKDMGCNAIRMAHNPPAQELLDLCDRMGFLVMDEAFDMWKKRKNRYDYNVEFAEWHRKDLEDMVRRDRNHPSIIAWSIGNEIREQFDSTGLMLTREMADLVRSLDPTRPVTSALTENVPKKNFIYQSGSLDVLGFNYKHRDYDSLPVRFPGQKFLAAETASALATRGHYDLPSDSNRVWPPDSKSTRHGNPDHTVSAYDHVYAYWGATHEESWKAVKKAPFMAGLFVWSGFDFLGEPVPYQWPSRSSYYGIIDLAGFPKDVYYLYQSEWTNKPVLHVFPHWNWQDGQVVDVWAYYNKADEVELFLNGRSLGVRRKEGDSMHVMWKVPFAPGVLQAVSRRGGKVVLKKEIRTAGTPARIELVASKREIKSDGEDLSFITIRVLDANGNLVPSAGQEIKLELEGPAFIAGVDNGDPVSMVPFKSNRVKAFHGLALAILQSGNGKGSVILRASGEGLKSDSIRLLAK